MFTTGICRFVPFFLLAEYDLFLNYHPAILLVCCQAGGTKIQIDFLPVISE